MKRFIGMALALFLSVGVTDASAQSFLRKLGKTVNDVSREVNKHVNKGTKNTSGTSKQQQKKSQTQEAASSNQSFEEQNERHLRILEEKGEIIRPVVVENPPKDQAPVTGKTNGHEWIDLGLPSGTRWATCNIGATTPSAPGGLYAWGETVTKTSYMPDNSKTHGKDMDDISGNATYDVATAKWGKGWRMPTKEEFDELVRYCPFPQYVKKNGRLGQEFTNTKNKRTLFLPATGHKEYGSKHENATVCGNYWTSTPQKDSYKNGAHEYHYGAALGEMGVGERSSGFAVRAVIDNDAMITVPSQGQADGHQWVDLGLPSGIKWAACNVGAKSSEELGHTFQWACIAPEIPDVSHRAESYGKWMSGIGGSAQYDAAASMWGGAWRMPTKVDIQELMDNCTWEYTTLGRVTGCKAISKINGNYIFFPFGYNDTMASYWTSIPMNSKSLGNYDAYALFMSKDMINICTKGRNTDHPIRPVMK